MMAARERPISTPDTLRTVPEPGASQFSLELAELRAAEALLRFGEGLSTTQLTRSLDTIQETSDLSSASKLSKIRSY